MYKISLFSGWNCFRNVTAISRISISFGQNLWFCWHVVIRDSSTEKVSNEINNEIGDEKLESGKMGDFKGLQLWCANWRGFFGHLKPTETYYFLPYRLSMTGLNCFSIGSFLNFSVAFHLFVYGTRLSYLDFCFCFRCIHFFYKVFAILPLVFFLPFL